MRFFPVISALFLLVSVGEAAAQSAEDSLLVCYRRMALDSDDDLKAAAKRIEACNELERAARAGRIPTLSAGGVTSVIRAIRWSIRPNCRESDR